LNSLCTKLVIDINQLNLKFATAIKAQIHKHI